MPKLFLIPCNLVPGDGFDHIPEVVKETLKGLDHFLVENVRSARRFISACNLGVDISSLDFQELNKDTQPQELSLLMKGIKGKDVGVLSEAGCPGIADPGALAAYWGHENGYEVVPLTGPSSITLALMASGFNGQSFAFQGYLPIKKEERARELQNLEKLAQQRDQTQIFIETPYRNEQMLEEILGTCHPETQLCIAVEITGKNGEVISKKVKNWKKGQVHLHKRPAIFLMYSK